MLLPAKKKKNLHSNTLFCFLYHYFKGYFQSPLKSVSQYCLSLPQGSVCIMIWRISFLFYFLRLLFLIWVIFKVFIESVTVLRLFYILVFGHKGYGILTLGPGIKPSPPELEGEFLTTGPPGKSQQSLLKDILCPQINTTQFLVRCRNGLEVHVRFLFQISKKGTKWPFPFIR